MGFPPSRLRYLKAVITGRLATPLVAYGEAFLDRHVDFTAHMEKAGAGISASIHIVSSKPSSRAPVAISFILYAASN
jgi:hypothetical protein